MANFGTTVNNLSWNVTNGFLASSLGAAFDTLQSKLANDGRDKEVKFYWDYNRGGSIFNVMARSLAGGAVSAIGNEAMAAYKQLIGGKKKNLKNAGAETLKERLQEAQEEDEDKYGKVNINNGKACILALDDWGNVCYDALMLSIPVAKQVKSRGNIGIYDAQGRISRPNASVLSDHLVWYDTTSLINLSSDKDLVLTRVTGRDYSRKELVSNGDLNFSVSGHITSNMPDVYPSHEVQKFRQIMQYKGIIEVNNEFLDQWGVKKIVIKSFSLPSSEGNKSTQDYTFEAVGIQPDTEANVMEDTIQIIDYVIKQETDNSDSLAWKDILKQQLEMLKSQSVALGTQGLALAGGYLDKAMAKM